ncbi:hypothetical protein [Nocardia sp. NPDC004722]
MPDTSAILIGSVVGGVLVCVASTGLARADFIDPTPFVDVNGVAWFNMAGNNCTIAPNGVVGCDLPAAAPMMSIAIQGVTARSGSTMPVPYVPAVVIDTSDAPAHPQWNSNGSHTQAGGNPVISPSPDKYSTSVSVNGATCSVMVRTRVLCSNMSHAFVVAEDGVSGA